MDEAEEELHYHLANYERAREVGSFESAERSLMKAGAWAAILTALRAGGTDE